MGFFWINPDDYLPADAKTVRYGKAKGVATQPEDFASYRQWLEDMRAVLGSDYPGLSHEAHLFATSGEPFTISTSWPHFGRDSVRPIPTS